MNRKICAFIAGAALLSLQGIGIASVDAPPKKLSKETRACVACHQKHNQGIVQQWGDSKHYGASVGCYECHAADASDVDAFIHEPKKVGKNKPVSIIVSPKDCSNCHGKEVKEFTESHHAQGGRILGSMDNLLAEVVDDSRSSIRRVLKANLRLSSMAVGNVTVQKSKF